jgi:polyribonucleotide nucleotidyltransferase
MYRKLEIDFSGRRLSLETGRLAKQAHGAVLAQYGETVVLATVVSAYEGRPNMDFLPLTVDYQERTFAAGKIPGGFFKREGRPSEKEILTSRIIDRSMRPLFPKGYDKETQIVVTVLSADRDNDPDMLSLIAASARWRRCGWAGSRASWSPIRRRSNWSTATSRWWSRPSSTRS